MEASSVNLIVSLGTMEETRDRSEQWRRVAADGLADGRRCWRALWRVK